MILYKDQQRPMEQSELLGTLGRLEKERPDDLARAKELFTNYVNPAIYYMPHPTVAQINALNCAFTEWCFFDFVLDPDPEGTPLAGGSVLEAAAERDDTLRRLADTQFFSSFWVIEQDAEHDLSLLRETTTCQDFIVHDHMMAHRRNWTQGVVNARIASIDGIWETCGKCLSHDKKESDPLPQSLSSSTMPRHDRSRFIALTRDLQGVNGRYLESVLAESFWPQQP